MCQEISTMSFCSCPGGGSYPGDISFTPPGGCQCPDPCEEAVIVNSYPNNSTRGCSCRSANGSVSGGILYVNQTITNIRCDRIDPPPPDCTTTTTSTTNPPPPNSSCDNSGGGN
jgi:hypothetical protein